MYEFEDLDRRWYAKYLSALSRLGWGSDSVSMAERELLRNAPSRLNDYEGYLNVSFGRLVDRLDLDELEFLRDEFVETAMTDPLRPQLDDVECYDLADEIQDVLEIRKYGRRVTSRIPDD